MDYARALVEHPKWRWEPGMVDTNGSAVLIVRDGDPLMAWYTPDRISDVGDEWATGAPPDINHPATKGWLLHMLREACETPRIWVEAVRLTDVPGEWSYRACGFMGCGAMGWQATEGEALAAALLAVWSYTLIDLLRASMEAISGINSVARGEPQASLKSGGEG